jgi:hypothetical protein
MPASHQRLTVILATWEEDHGLRPAQANIHETSSSKYNQSKIDWRCGSSGKAPVL